MVAFINRVISIDGRKTTMRLTDLEWTILDNICYAEKIRRKNLLELISGSKSAELGLTSSVRLFSLLYLYKHSPRISASGSDLQNIIKFLR